MRFRAGKAEVLGFRVAAAIVSSSITLERPGFPTPHLERVMALHRFDSKKLGFFPRGAFEEHARLRQIIVALDSVDNCIGYLLYRVARGRASIVHLCVAEAARGKGVATLLSDRLKQETTLLEGIGLYCRRDYEATYVWPKLGFEAIHAKTGRGKDLAELTFWWFSHGHKDLFSRVTEPDPVRQRVVIDANVFYDLHTRQTPESEDSKALLADWVQASIELVATKELRNEIAKGTDELQRRQNRADATRYTTLSAEDASFQKLCTELRPKFPESVTLRDEADLRQVAYAIAGGAPFLVTRDGVLVDRCEPLYQSHGLKVLHPAELINHLDSVEREGDYRPARIEGSRLKNALLKAEALDAAVANFKAADEREGDFKKAVLRCLAQPKATDVQVITDNSNAHILLGVMDRQRPDTLTIPVLRHSRHPMAATMFRNFLRACLAAAANERRSIVTITDTRLGDGDRNILKEFGFSPCENVWAKIALQSVGNLDLIRKALSELSLDSSLESAKQSAVDAVNTAAQLCDSAACAVIERQLWPVKVIESNVPTFIVSIKPKWAQHFFDAELGSQLLWGLREDLHLGVEGVYYRSAENNNLTVPGRVLWYVSKDTGDGSMTIKACSQLEEVVVGKPKELFRRFQRLGVYEWRDVYEAADKNISNDIMAFRFRMTERFHKPIEIETLEALGIRGPFMSPRKISDSQFASIYQKGYTFA
jgi:predicted nucleic acid-binding protein/GNAT superfamily N-acetyltransferase